MRSAALETIGELVREDPRVVFIGSDLGSGVLQEARAAHPDRVLMEGIAEQHIVSFASGLALEGFVPFVHTIGTFLTRRALEQVIIDVALEKLPVILLGSGGGMVYAPLGPTHQSIDDFALMRAVPGMAVTAPADPLEMRELLHLIRDREQPAYVRIAKGGEPTVTGFLPPIAWGKFRLLRDGKDLAILTTGSLLHACLRAVDLLKSEGIEVSLLHSPFVDPLDTDALEAVASSHSEILVVEEHIPRGGLSSAVVDELAEQDISCRVSRATLPNSYANKYGSQSEHWAANRLDAVGLEQRVRKLLK